MSQPVVNTFPDPKDPEYLKKCRDRDAEFAVRIARGADASEEIALHPILTFNFPEGKDALVALQGGLEFRNFARSDLDEILAMIRKKAQGLPLQVGFLSEAWVSVGAKKNEDGEFVRPSKDPARKEAIISNHVWLNGHNVKNEMRLYDMIRASDGTRVISGKVSDMSDGEAFGPTMDNLRYLLMGGQHA